MTIKRHANRLRERLWKHAKRQATAPLHQPARYVSSDLRPARGRPVHLLPALPGPARPWHDPRCAGRVQHPRPRPRRRGLGPGALPAPGRAAAAPADAPVLHLRAARQARAAGAQHGQHVRGGVLVRAGRAGLRAPRQVGLRRLFPRAQGVHLPCLPRAHAAPGPQPPHALGGVLRALKRCICLTADARTPHQVHYHPLRSAACDALEGVIALLLALSRAGGALGHELAWGDHALPDSETVTLRRMPPIEEIVALVRTWHSGDAAFPVATATDSQDALASAACLRRALRNPELAAVVALHEERVRAVATRGAAYCAGCTDAVEEYARAEGPGYDRAVLASWDRVRPFATHRVRPGECRPEPLRLVYCCQGDSVQLRSFAYYRAVLSAEFPAEFRLACPRKFYSLALQ